MMSLDLTWNQVAAEFQKDMDLLAWNLPENYFANGPEVLHQLIFELLQSQPKSITELLYRMGIEETSIGHFFESPDMKKLAHQLSETIIERAKLRIQLRKQFSV